ncbi:HigA family addiction module antitoxin [Nodosilinea sp. PGN35]|uniref:HigA family addiction module antitoxin n=1 Tax=Nodosilinea sp. PGN35 TaxID=3020489 RepID=UPI0023B2498E|nr:HigA family addiction module antitoxin [Nodosilinea sp. TSF1-S3]MDF0364984.1 HigA family addiction module antitoxin [Nodosilinea sp. TSF1-S3]
MTQTLVPARVSPPGRILNRELEARGWTQKDLAEIMGRPHQTINGIINGNKQITPETAIELAEALGTSAEFWTNLEAKYRLHLAQKEVSGSPETREISRRSRLYSFAPVAEMIKRGWIQAADSIDVLEQEVCRFFEIDQIGDVPNLAVNCRQSENRDPEIQAQLAWMKRVEIVVRDQKLPTFDRAKLEAAIPEILALSSKAENVALVPDKLLSLGIHFAVVPHLGKTYLDGAAFYIESRPVIALTLRYKRIDNFWFTLMHELGHIFAGHKGSYLDNMDNLEVNQEETEANQLATNWLLNSHELSILVKTTAPYFSVEKIQKFALDQNRHPGILVGRLQKDKEIPYKNHTKFLVPVNKLLTPWVFN